MLSPLRRPDPMRVSPVLPAPVRAVPRLRSVLFVNPFYPKDPHASYGKHVLTPTLALTSLAGATPAGWSQAYWDENLLQGPPPTDYVPEVVAITVHLTFSRRAYALADWFRARGSVVILGGLHVLSCPDEVIPHADAVCVGNGVPVWPRILADVAAGTLQQRYEARYEDYSQDPAPDRSILPKWGFLTPLSVIATQGCHNRCDFCYLSTGDLRIKYQMRRIEQVVDDFRQSDQPYAVFIDNNLGSSRKYLRELCRALAPLERIWSAAVSIDVTDDPSLVREMALAGCTGVFVGFESLQDDNLKDAGKRTPKAADYARRVSLFHDYGIQVNSSFVVGFDHDDETVFERTADWVAENRIECATYHILTPYPGTPLFARMKAEGRILHEDWERYDTGHCVFVPKQMSPERLEEGYAWLYDHTFSWKGIWERRPVDRTAAGPYLAMSALYKRANGWWPQLIQKRLTHAVWAPLVEATRVRHVAYRKQLAARETGGEAGFTAAWRPGV